MKVAVIMGSKSDYPKLEDGIKLLERFDVEVSVRALSAHRTPKQLVGLPIKSSTMDGLDSLLSIVQMPPGIPVATVTIDSGINAALMALQIISIKYPKVKEDLVLYRKEMEEKVLEDDKNLRG